MQEHIRRAHPEYYIPKLPATKESFDLMITSPPHERPPPPEASQQPQLEHHRGTSPAFNLDSQLQGSYDVQGYGQHDGGYYTNTDQNIQDAFTQLQQRSSDEYRRGSLIPAASAAAALAQLHYHRPDSDWGGDVGQVIYPSLQLSPTVTEADFLQNFYAHPQNDFKHENHFVDPALEDHGYLQGQYGPTSASQEHQPGLLPSSMAQSPPERSTTLPPLQRSLSRSNHNRPRKSSLSQQARLAKHERKKSRDAAKRHSGERKAFSAEPSAAALYGKRWEDLIDAATSATEEDSRDLTPVSPADAMRVDWTDRAQIPASPYQSPQVPSRTSLPPFALGSQFQSFQASPLNRALTPPAPDPGLDLQPFPSVESSLSSSLSMDPSNPNAHLQHTSNHSHAQHSSHGSGSNFQILQNSDSSPMFQNPVQIYCAGCRRLSVLKDSYACTDCICGLCGTCVEALVSGQSRGRMSVCPRCQSMASSFKPFQLDLR